jgi:hypothetical protein
MKTSAFTHTTSLTAVILTLAFTSAAEGTTVIGNTTTDRGGIDGYSGQMFILNANLSSLAGQVVTSWSFFNNNTTNAVTPVLVEDMGGSFAVRGIGTTIVSNASGMQGGAFGLVSGTSTISLNYYAGFFDGSWNGSTATVNTGAVEFNSADDPPVPGQINSTGTIWLHNAPDGSDNPANLGVGAVNLSDTNFDTAVTGRHYSINFTAVPEPSVALLGGLTGLALLRRRRTA